jgi:hypothetical protein
MNPSKAQISRIMKIEELKTLEGALCALDMRKSLADQKRKFRNQEIKRRERIKEIESERLLWAFL